jgi:chloride channel 2
LKFNFVYLSKFLKVATLSYPNGLGRFIAGELSTHEQVLNLFTNFTWSDPNLNVEQAAVVKYWTNPFTDEVFSILLCYLLYTVIT